MIMMMTFGVCDALAGCEGCTGCSYDITPTIGSEVAHSSMGGGTLVNTTAIFNAFPHMVIENGNGAELDSEQLCFPGTHNFSDPGAFGRAWWECKEDMWLILDVGRQDYGVRSANFMWGHSRAMGGGFSGMDFGNVSFPGYTDYEALAHPWINLGIAKPRGEGAWSANLFFGADNAKDAAGDNDLSEGSSGIGALFSWGNGQGLNASAEILAKSESYEFMSGTDVAEDKASFFSGAFNVRKDTETRIYQGSLVFGSGSLDLDAFDDDHEDTVFGIYASTGRFLKNTSTGQATVELYASMSNWKYTYGDDEDKYSEIVFPGVRVSAWEQISTHFGVMGAVYGGYFMSGHESSNGADPDPDTDDSANSHWYDWTAGIFYQPKANVRVDMQLNPENMSKLLSVGNDDPLVVYVGATIGLN